MLVPMVVTRTANGERAQDIYSCLLENRIIFLTQQFEDQMASVICAQLLFLDSQSSEKPIYIYINSPGGQVTSALAIYDTIQYIKAPVHTIVMGMAASAGSLILAAGAPGHRYALPNAKVLLHQPSAGMGRNTVTDLIIQADDLIRTKKQLNDIYVHHTGHTYEKIESTLERDHIMNAQESLDFCIVDKIITSADQAV